MLYRSHLYEYKSVFKHSLFQIISLEDQECNVAAYETSVFDRHLCICETSVTIIWNIGNKTVHVFETSVTTSVYETSVWNIGVYVWNIGKFQATGVSYVFQIFSSTDVSHTYTDFSCVKYRCLKNIWNIGNYYCMKDR